MEEIRSHLANHDFRSLFIERLGWDIAHSQFTGVGASGQVVLTRVAHKRGVQAFTCEVDYATLVDRKLLRQIESQLSHHAAVRSSLYCH